MVSTQQTGKDRGLWNCWSPGVTARLGQAVAETMLAEDTRHPERQPILFERRQDKI